MPHHEMSSMLTSTRKMLSSFSIGAIAGMVDAAINLPLWVLKTRTQYNDHFTLNPSVLYRGIETATPATAFIITVNIWGYRSILYFHYKTKRPTFYQSSVSAFFGGVASAVPCTPLDLSLTLQQADKTQHTKNAVTTYTRYLQRNGLGKTFPAFSSIALRNGCFSLAFLSLVPSFKQQLQRYVPNDLQNSIYSGIIIGIIATIFLHPLDTIKTVQQAKADRPGKAVPSALKTCKEIVRSSGIKRGLYAGFFWHAANSLRRNNTGLSNRRVNKYC